MTNDKIPNRGQPQQINLNQIAQDFMSGLQRHFDLLAFNLAAHDTVQEETYNKHVNASRIMPSAKNHQNFEQLQAYTRDLLSRQLVNDSLKLALTAMNNAHFFLALIKITGANTKVDPETQKQAHETQQNFVRAQLDEKFDRLEKDYGIMCELEDSITSLGLILQALVQHKNIVQKSQLDDDGKLLLELKSIEIPENTDLTTPPPGKLVDLRKTYQEGDIVSFNGLELQLILVTIASFADSLFKAVAEYARSVRKDS